MINNLTNEETVVIDNICIKKSSSWSFAIEIKVDLRQYVDLVDLYSVLKSYLFSPLVVCNYVAIGFNYEYDKYIVFNKISTISFKKILFDEFLEWYDHQLDYLKKYDIKIEDTLVVLVVLEKDLVNLKKIDLDTLKPKYPWSSEWVNFIKIPSYFKQNAVKRLYLNESSGYDGLLYLEIDENNYQPPEKQSLLDVCLFITNNSVYVEFSRSQFTIVISMLKIKLEYSLSRFYKIELNKKIYNFENDKNLLKDFNIITIDGIENFNRFKKATVYPVFSDSEKTITWFKIIIGEWKFRK